MRQPWNIDLGLFGRREIECLRGARDYCGLLGSRGYASGPIEWVIGFPAYRCSTLLLERNKSPSFYHSFDPRASRVEGVRRGLVHGLPSGAGYAEFGKNSL